MSKPCTMKRWQRWLAIVAERRHSAITRYASATERAGIRHTPPAISVPEVRYYRSASPRQRRCPLDAYCGNGWTTIATETLGQVREPLSIDRKNIFFELFVERFFYSIVRHHLFFKYVGTCFRRLDSFDNLAVSTSLSSLKGCDCFLCHSCILFYLISLCTVTRLRIGLYFFNSKRSVVFLRFLVVM